MTYRFDAWVQAASGGIPETIPRIPYAFRFWSHVLILGESECWPWLSASTPRKYGVTNHGGKQVRAHRVAWMLANRREVPDGLIVCHRCDNPRCCNPAHLFVGSHADNNADKVAKGRQVRGERDAAAKLTEADVRMIRKSGESAYRIARRLGVDDKAVLRVRKGLTWRHVK